MVQIDELPSGALAVKFQYKPWLVDAMRKIPGAEFRGAQKYWVVPISSRDALFNWAQPFLTKKTEYHTEIGEIEPLPELEIDIPLKREMFAFQKQGVAYCLKKPCVIIGDEPGLGKSGQAIAAVQALNSKCVLIICPNTIKQNWKIEIEQLWTNEKAIILSDKVKATWPTFYRVGMVKFFIVNYESLKKFFVAEIKVFLDKHGEKQPLRLNHIVFKESINLFDAVIIDEIHRCKEGRTMQSKLTMGICKGKSTILALTGTPVVNKPKDLITQLYTIGKLDLFGGYKRFVDRYCQEDTPHAHLKELNYLMHKHCFYRREKKSVLTDLPDKMRNIVRVDISNRDEYKKAEDNFIAYLRENMKKTDGEISVTLRGEAMVQIQILKKIAAKGKIDQVIDHIQEVVDAGEKISIFAWHTEIVNSLKDAIPGAVTIVGSDSLEERQRSIEGFQNEPEVQVIICNIKSGGVGITLTAASRMGFIELPWHPADADQCEDRHHRIGQKNSVECTYFLGYDTIDEYIYGIIERKRKVVQAVMGDEGVIETNMIDEFLNLFMKEKLPLA